MFAAAFALWSWSGAGVTTNIGSTIGSLAFIPLNLGAVYWLWRASRNRVHSNGERNGLLLLAAMYVCTALGNAFWAFDEVVRGVDPRYAWANVFYIVSYLIGIAALSRFPLAPRGVTELRKFLLDVACIVIAVGVLVWTFIVSPVSWGSIDPEHAFIELAYPVVCIVALGMLSRLVMRQAVNHQYRDFTILAVAIFIQSVVDLILQLDYRNQITQLTPWAAAICPGMYVMIVYGAERSARRTESGPSDPPDPSLNPINLLPTIAALAVYAVLIWAARSEHREPLGALVGAAIVLNILFLAKQTIAVRENAALLAARTAAEGRARFEELVREGQKLEAVGRLAGGIAHDFNNLLTTVLGNADFALSQLKAGDTAHDEVSDIRVAAVRGAELIRQLLAFSRRSIVAPVQLQPELVLRDMERLLQRLAGDRCGILLESTSDVGLVQVDRGQLEQALANLVTNGRDAMPEGGAIVIACRNVTLDEGSAASLALQAGDYVTVAVQDSGVGIAPEVRDQIFEPFFSTKARGKGTGLGLASTYGIMRQSHGAIGVQSETGIGSIFTLYLPRVRQSVQAGIAAEPVSLVPLQLGRGETILLVEDEVMVRQVTRRILESEGYNVLTAPDAVGARSIFERHGASIALMITDVMMPGESGVELAAFLRREWPELRVIFISGYSDSELPERDSQSGADDFVQKPFTGAQLLSRVNARLRGAHRPAPSVGHSR